MNEDKWLKGDDAEDMLAWLRLPRFDRLLTGRKLRLLACACCRSEWAALPDHRSRYAVKMAERYADGREAYAVRLRDACVAAAQAIEGVSRDDDPLGYLAHDASIAPDCVCLATAAGLPAGAADAVRDLFGNPFRPLRVEPSTAAVLAELYSSGSVNFDIGTANSFHLTQNVLTPTVLSVARGAYEERTEDGLLDGERLLILADALEEAGCANAESPAAVRRDIDTMNFIMSRCFDDEAYRYYQCTLDGLYARLQEAERPHPLLEHLRSGGKHYLGCHAVDAILGKR